jgi:hypothetical protein
MLPLPSIRVPCFGRSWTIWKHKEARPRPPTDCLKLERTLSDIINQAYALTSAEIEPMWETAPPRPPIPPPAAIPECDSDRRGGRAECRRPA